MKFTELRADFGKLDNARLTLGDGLNIIQIPNEGGKTTWCDFITAMLYGVDTRQRASAGTLPVKALRAPWNGHPMAGSAVLEHNGERITIERSSTPKAPMGVFRAVYPGGGEAPGLTGDNCGEVLIGAEKSVFERSAFLRQRGAEIEKDAALERRLTALVSTGEETFSYSEVAEKLKKLKNSIRSNNGNGMLPKLNEQLEAVRNNLAEIAASQQQLAGTEESLRLTEAAASETESTLNVLDALAAAERQKRAEEAGKSAADEEARAEGLRRRCAELPPKQELEQLKTDTGTLKDRLQQLQPAVLPEKPDTPDVFEGLNPEQALQKAQSDTAEYHRLTAPAAVKNPLLLPGLLLLFAGIVLGAALAAAVSPLWGLSGLPLLLCGAVLLLAGFGRKRKADAEAAERRHSAALLLAGYRVKAPEGMLQTALGWRDALRAYNAAAKTARDTANSGPQTAWDALFDRAAVFTERPESISQLDERLQNALGLYNMLENAETSAAQLRKSADDLRAMAGPAPDITVEDAAYYESLDRETVEQQYAAQQAALETLREQRTLLRGKISAVTDPLEAALREDEITARIADLTRKNAALQLAAEALSDANTERQARFAPMLCQSAGALLSRLTGGKYNTVEIDKDMNIRVRESGSTVSRTLTQLSGGTVDQVYLAVRLAICDLLLPGAPVVLDDALAQFDDERCALALRVLKEEGELRQLLLFTCHSREAALLRASANPPAAG